MNLGLKNKVAIVTAASQGLGKASAFALAREGAKVIICSRRQKEIKETAEEIIKGTGSEVISLVADLRKADDIKKIVNEAKDRFGTLHILVNNTGGPPTGTLHNLEDQEWYNAFDLVMMSAVRLVREAIPLMLSQNWGRIITIVSIVAKQPINELLISSSIRPGILGFTKVMANLYGKNNITVNTICPGHILTKRQEELAFERAKQKNITIEEYFEEVKKQIPAGRLGKPEEVADAVAFLASEQASYINGINLLVDGGAGKGIY